MLASERRERNVSSWFHLSHIWDKIDTEGIHPLPEKLEAIRDAPRPTCVTVIKAYLGILTYYSKFLPNMSTVLAPLYELLQKVCQWKWDKEKERAFQESKKLLTSSQLLVHFNPQLKVTLACDASAYGVGAVLAHQMADGMKKSIAYASRNPNVTTHN